MILNELDGTHTSVAECQILKNSLSTIASEKVMENTSNGFSMPFSYTIEQAFTWIQCISMTYRDACKANGEIRCL